MPKTTSNQKPTLEEVWTQWIKDRDPAKRGYLLQALQPTIESAIRTHAGGRNAPSVRSRARILAARALEKWDPKKGSKLKGYIFQQLQPLTRYSARAGQPMPIPERAEHELRRVKQAQRELTLRTGREPTQKEMSDHLKLSQQRIAKILGHYSHPTVSESQIGAQEDDPDKSDFAPAVTKPNYNEIWADYVYTSLDPTDQKIMEWRTGRNGVKLKSNQEIAKELNLSPGAVSQRAGKITAQLKEGMEYGES